MLPLRASNEEVLRRATGPSPSESLITQEEYARVLNNLAHRIK